MTAPVIHADLPARIFLNMARILTIADCFDAMTAKRPYKQALSVEYAVNELEKNSGTQFDPVLVKKFVELIHEGKISIA